MSVGLAGAHIVHVSFLFMLFYQTASTKYSLFLRVALDRNPNKRNREGVK
jgi:hypothetical protein